MSSRWTDHSSKAQKPRPIVISGPSGSGKSTHLNRLLAEFPDRFGFSISHTTRAPRGTEENGKEYHFVTKDDFLKLVDAAGFIEHAQFGSNYYGTSVQAVKDVAEKDRTCILDIEMEVCCHENSGVAYPSPFPDFRNLGREASQED